MQAGFHQDCVVHPVPRSSLAAFLRRGPVSRLPMAAISNLHVVSVRKFSHTKLAISFQLVYSRSGTYGCTHGSLGPTLSTRSRSPRTDTPTYSERARQGDRVGNKVQRTPLPASATERAARAAHLRCSRALAAGWSVSMTRSIASGHERVEGVSASRTAHSQGLHGFLAARPGAERAL